MYNFLKIATLCVNVT